MLPFSTTLRQKNRNSSVCCCLSSDTRVPTHAYVIGPVNLISALITFFLFLLPCIRNQEVERDVSEFIASVEFTT